MTIPLNPQQQAVATQIYTTAVRHGIPPVRARELVQAAYSESGLNPAAVNRSSGAAGPFQLLSSGYVQKAEQLGGVHNVKANELAILPAYAKYWQGHPGAAPGAAGRDVELSGKGAGFYDPQLELGFLGGHGRAAAVGAPTAAVGAPAAPAAAMGTIDPAARAQFAMQIISNIGNKGPVDWQGLTQSIGALNAAHQQAQLATPAAAPAEAAPAVHPAAIVKGGYAFPVAGPSNFTDTWGAYRADTGHHEGVDVFAKRGTPVVAITNGVITKMGPSSIGGNRVWINGEWYYAHLDGFAPGIKVGVKVHRGQVLGFVGDTGDAKGTPTHLHFGYSPDGSQGASWANPYGLLKRLHG